MAVIALTEPVANVSQLAVYNQNIGGGLNRSATFSVPGGINWAVVGCVLADAATPALVEDTLVPAITALTQVTSVHGDQIYGQLPASVQAGYECVLHVSSQTALLVASNDDTFTQVLRSHETVTPPAAKKWCVLLLRVPAALDNAKIAALESAITGINGVTLTEHLIDGTIPARTSGNATFTVSAHLRIEAVQV